MTSGYRETLVTDTVYRLCRKINAFNQSSKSNFTNFTNFTQGLNPRTSIMAHSNSFNNLSSNCNTDATPVVSNSHYDTRSCTQIVLDEIITPYENDPSLVFEDLADFLRLSKIKMDNAEKLKFIAAVVKAYNLSSTCKVAINAQCVSTFGGGL